MRASMMHLITLGPVYIRQNRRIRPALEALNLVSNYHVASGGSHVKQKEKKEEQHKR